MNENNQVGGHANESLRFVQLSDLHLSSIGIPNPLRLLNKRVLGYLSWLRRRRHTHQRWVLELAIETIRQLNIDHYAITGDLTHIGLKNEFEQAKEWLENLGDPYDITVIPGNHDLYTNEQWSRSFKLWESYLYDDNEISNNSYSNNGLTRLNELYPIIRLRKNVAFIGVNSVFDAPWFRATGRINELELKRLKNILNSKKLDAYCKILLIHHPITLTNTAKRKSLLNHEELISLLKKYPVNLVLHGHGHHSCIESLRCNNDFEIPVIGMSSSSSISQQPNYQAQFLLFEVSRNAQQWKIAKQSYTLNINKKSFSKSSTEKLTTKHICAQAATE